jgi:hypothetical protein
MALAVRPDYQNIGIKTDPITNTEKLGIDMVGHRAWQGEDSALHAQQALAQQASARRKAMGFDDDEGDADDEWREWAAAVPGCSANLDVVSRSAVVRRLLWW